jgi:hypothetical protein
MLRNGSQKTLPGGENSSAFCQCATCPALACFR